MILYNVTINLEEGLSSQWVKYMKEEHIPDVMKTGCFKDSRLCELLTKQPDEKGTTYSIQYSCEDMEAYDDYKKNHATELQKDHNAKFGGKFVAFRSLMVEL